jgi:pimeloyl-ACP methyl ester carboxylesterase
MDPLIPIFLLHGLGASPITLWPLEQYLQFVGGFNNTHRLLYPVDTTPFEECLDYVDKEMLQHANKEQEVILIGQSMGGVIANNMHKKGWKVKMAVYIGSPLHGANLLNQLENILPTKVRNALYKLPYDYLKVKDREPEPPHPYHTISMAWPFTEFDGCVYKHETMLDEDKHTHLAWADHRTIFANPRLWHKVFKIIMPVC